MVTKTYSDKMVHSSKTTKKTTHRDSPVHAGKTAIGRKTGHPMAGKK